MSGDGGDADGSAVERWEAVASLCTGVAHTIRVAIVASLHQAGDRPLTQVADQIAVSRSAVQKHVSRLEEADLVYRPEREGQTYALTPFGRLFALLLEQHGDVVVDALQRVEAAKADCAEVLVCMHASSSDDECALHRGTRVRKNHTSRRDAFETVGAKPLGTVAYEAALDSDPEAYRQQMLRQLILRKTEFLARECPPQLNFSFTRFYPKRIPKIPNGFIQHHVRSRLLEIFALGETGH
jgi:DNA-binding transcriptional ArsR family regulator